MNRHLNLRIAQHASTHYGVISRAEARRIGLSARQIEGLVGRGEWERVASGVYRVAAAPRLDRTPLAVALASTGGWASHRSAAELHGLLAEVPRRPEIVLPSAVRRRADAVVRRSDALPRGDLTRRGGLACTSATRTLIDLGAVLPTFELEGVVNRAVAARQIRRSDLVARFDALATHGRPGIARMRDVLSRLPDGTPALESHLELLLLEALRRHGAPEPERQVVVQVDGATYRLDFAYPPEKVYLEGNGFGVHADRLVFESDHVRRNRLVVDGWLPLEYTMRMVRRAPARCARDVLAVLALRRPPGTRERT